jgi:hypothetical protein
MERKPPRVYLRVGPDGSGHTRFIKHLSETYDLQLFMKHTITPKKFCYGPGNQQFYEKVKRCEQPKMVAFDNFRVKDMCKPSPIVYGFKKYNSLPKHMDMVVFSMNDKGMNSCGEVDADDVLRHVFPKGAFEAHSWMLYRMIAEIHHMLPDGTVRILAVGGKKLDEAIVLTPDACMARETVRMNSL